MKKHSTITPHILAYCTIETPLGAMYALADDTHLYLLEFENRKNFDRQIAHLARRTSSTRVSGKTAPLVSIEKELNLYFQGKLTEFKTPLKKYGSSFQEQVWQELEKISHGQTYSYKDIALALHMPKAFRAVARANSTNRLAIIVPCHRVIAADGKLSGYAGGVDRKQWLLNHERQLHVTR